MKNYILDNKYYILEIFYKLLITFNVIKYNFFFLQNVDK